MKTDPVNVAIDVASFDQAVTDRILVLHEGSDFNAGQIMRFKVDTLPNDDEKNWQEKAWRVCTKLPDAYGEYAKIGEAFKLLVSEGSYNASFPDVIYASQVNGHDDNIYTSIPVADFMADIAAYTQSHLGMGRKLYVSLCHDGVMQRFAFDEKERIFTSVASFHLRFPAVTSKEGLEFLEEKLTNSTSYVADHVNQRVLSILQNAELVSASMMEDMGSGDQKAFAEKLLKIVRKELEKRSDRQTPASLTKLSGAEQRR